MKKLARLLTFRVAIYCIIVASATVTFWLAYQHKGTDREAFLENLWLGLFCSALQVCFVVLVVENLMKRDQSNRTRPARAAAFRHALRIHGRSTLLWQNMVQSTFEKAPDLKLLDHGLKTLVDSRFVPLVTQLDLSTIAPVQPTQPWRQYMLYALTDMRSEIGNCLTRYSAHMEPDLIFALQELENSPPFAAFVSVHQHPDILAMTGDRLPFMNVSPIECILRLRGVLEKQVGDLQGLLPGGTHLDNSCTVYIERMREKFGATLGPCK